MPAGWPELDALLDGAVAYRLPLTSRFRGLTEREGLLIRGPSGWGEFAPFSDYDLAMDARWLASAVEAAWGDWPTPQRHVVPVNAIVPAVDPDAVRDLVLASGCSTVKVKVAEPGQTLADDVGRVGAVRDALGTEGRVRVDANGAWSVDDAVRSIAALIEFGLEYVEQPCSTIDELASVRTRVDVPIAVDEGIRRSPNPRAVTGVREAADVVILKAAPLGGVSAALDVASAYGLPVVVSSALESSIGLAAGLALAAAIPRLDYACGLGTGRLLGDDVSDDPLVPSDGALRVRRVTPDPAALDRVRASTQGQRQWLARATVAYQEWSKVWLTRGEGASR